MNDRQNAAHAEAADSIWSAATVHCGMPFATHIAVRRGRIIAVGDASSICVYANGATEHHDFPTGAITAGLSDAHMHPIWGLETVRGVDLRRADSLDDVATVLQREAGSEEQWVLGWGLDPNVFGGRGVDGRSLDPATLGKPMMLVFRDTHSAIVNSAGIDVLGLSGKEVFSDGSEVAVDGDGRPTGHLKELGAVALARAVIPEQSIEGLAESLLALLASMAATGLVSAQAMDFDDRADEILEEAERSRDLPVRLRLSPLIPAGTELFELPRYLHMQGRHGRRWIVEGVKFMIDGTVDTGTAWLETADSHGQGLHSLWDDVDRYADAVRYFAARGVPIATHAIGERGVRHVLDVVASLPDEMRVGAVHRIEHIESIPDETVARFATLGVVASMQPIHATRHGRADLTDTWATRLGRRRAMRSMRTRDLLDAGVTLALGSDWPVVDYDPRGVIADSVLRRPFYRPDLEPIGASQALTVREAIDAYTLGSASARGAAGVEGRIAVGHRADFTVFGGDPLTASAEQLAVLPVLATAIAGSRVSMRGGA